MFVGLLVGLLRCWLVSLFVGLLGYSVCSLAVVDCWFVCWVADRFVGLFVGLLRGWLVGLFVGLLGWYAVGWFVGLLVG